MKFVDMHCDTLTSLYKNPVSGSLKQNRLSVDLDRLKKNGRVIQFFACFVNLKDFMKKCMEKSSGPDTYDLDSAYEYVCTVLDRFDDFTTDNKVLCRLVKTPDDIDAVLYSEGKEQTALPVGAVLTVEEGGILDGSMERLESLFHRGVRLITLTWNYVNCMGYPNCAEPAANSKGLTSFGFQVVRRMEELGMIVDVSHMSDGGFFDVAKTMKKPFVASHSNARALCAHPRNLTDEMLKILGEHGGVAGLNFCPGFLDQKNGCTLEAMTAHVRHIIHVAGEDAAALGTDFDGISGKLAITGTDQMYLLHQALESCGLPERVIDKVWYGNAVRVMKDVFL